MRFNRIKQWVLVALGLIVLTGSMPAGLASAKSYKPVHGSAAHSEHHGSQSPACVSLCTAHVLKPADQLTSPEQEEDDPTPTRYQPPFSQLIISNTLYAQSLHHNKLRLVSWRPPDVVAWHAAFRF